MIGCGAAFGTPPSTQSLIINLDTGDVLANITPAGGNDEVWFDPASQHYYLAARGTRGRQQRQGDADPRHCRCEYVHV